MTLSTLTTCVLSTSGMDAKKRTPGSFPPGALDCGILIQTGGDETLVVVLPADQQVDSGGFSPPSIMAASHLGGHLTTAHRSTGRLSPGHATLSTPNPRPFRHPASACRPAARPARPCPAANYRRQRHPAWTDRWLDCPSAPRRPRRSCRPSSRRRHPS